LTQENPEFNSFAISLRFAYFFHRLTGLKSISFYWLWKYVYRNCFVTDSGACYSRNALCALKYISMCVFIQRIQLMYSTGTSHVHHVYNYMIEMKCSKVKHSLNLIVEMW